MKLIDEIRKLIQNNEFSEALRKMNSALEVDMQPKEEAGILFERGKLFWKIGNRQAAMCDYLKAAELDENSPANQALEHAREIESFFNPDLLNP